MTIIRPFKGIRYNQQLIEDLAAVICPPYDVINEKQQERLYNRSDYNFIRIEYNKETEQDNETDNRYTRARSYINKWLEDRILREEDQPALYLHRHSFEIMGRDYQRINLLALVRLEEWDKRIIRPHENIIPKAKSDRMSMLRTCQANTSTVLAMYSDPKRKMADIFDQQHKNIPVIDFIDDTDERHEVWAVDRPEAIAQIQEMLADQPLYIADGHHRYDSALTYRRERTAENGSATGEEGYNYVMMNLFDFEDSGLVIMPTHRLVKGIPAKITAGMKTALKAHFDITELSMKSANVWDKFDKLCGVQTLDSSQVRLGICGLENDRLLVLTLRDIKSVESLMPPGHSETYRKLDVSVVDHLILERLMGFVKDSDHMQIDYNHNRVEAVKQVKDNHYQMAFILGGVNPESIKLIADAGDRMPRKSTYFYPKAPAGLVFYKW
jgi:uncharacterized protein (DUF1015 family)